MAQAGGWVFGEQAEAKYRKLAYSSRFGFSGDFPTRIGHSITDSTLAVIDVERDVRRVRDHVDRAEVRGAVALSRWSPFPGVVIDTALAGGAPWHVRLHRVATNRSVQVVETGFALPYDPDDGLAGASDGGRIESAAGASTITDVTPAGGPARDGAVRTLPPNANMMHPHAVVPLLEVKLVAGTHWLASAVGASDDATAVATDRAPIVDDEVVAELEAFSARCEEATA
jgi:hypothetical protein